MKKVHLYLAALFLSHCAFAASSTSFESIFANLDQSLNQIYPVCVR